MATHPILEAHATEAALLWPLREAAARAPHYDLPDLAKLDERVEANVDGLRLGGDAAWKICRAALSVDDPGEFFAASVIATDRGDLPGIAAILDAGGDVPKLRRGIVGGLAWVAPDKLTAILPGLLDPMCPPALHLLGIAASTAHAQDPGDALDRAVHSDHPSLRARALEAVGELGRRNLAHPLRVALAGEDTESRIAAAWSLALSGEAPALAVLADALERPDAWAERATAVVFRRLEPKMANDLIRRLSLGAATCRYAIQGAGALGEPDLIPWLIEQMYVPAQARVAGEAFTLITGADIETEHLRGKAPEGFVFGPTEDPDDDDVAPDPDENLPWPHADLVKRWWSKNRGKLAPRTRHLLGQPITNPWCADVLERGRQRHRAAAALELHIASPGKPLFPVCAPVPRQRRLLQTR